MLFILQRKAGGAHSEIIVVNSGQRLISGCRGSLLTVCFKQVGNLDQQASLKGPRLQERIEARLPWLPFQLLDITR